MSDVRINGAALREIRERSGVSVTGLATSVGMKQSHLSNIEAGRRNTTDDKIVLLARELKCPLPAILTDPYAEVLAS